MPSTTTRPDVKWATTAIYSQCHYLGYQVVVPLKFSWMHTMSKSVIV